MTHSELVKRVVSLVNSDVLHGSSKGKNAPVCSLAGTSIPPFAWVDAISKVFYDGAKPLLVDQRQAYLSMLLELSRRKPDSIRKNDLTECQIQQCFSYMLDIGLYVYGNREPILPNVESQRTLAMQDVLVHIDELQTSLKSAMEVAYNSEVYAPMHELAKQLRQVRRDVVYAAYSIDSKDPLTGKENEDLDI